ncbi:hypothetical protein Aduo_002162 [Ancylostoma duodenale]
MRALSARLIRCGLPPARFRGCRTAEPVPGCCPGAQNRRDSSCACCRRAGDDDASENVLRCPIWATSLTSLLVVSVPHLLVSALIALLALARSFLLL